MRTPGAGTVRIQTVTKADMEYVTADTSMAEEIRRVLHTTIQTVYPKYYPRGVVDFFCGFHSIEHIQEGIASEGMGVLLERGVIAGTGCFDGNHITGVYVLPHCQGKGFGSYIMDCLEAKIKKQHQKSILDASLPAVRMYERRGYRTVGHGVIDVGNGERLVYEQMEKVL